MADVGSGDAGREQSSGPSPTATPGGGNAINRVIVSTHPQIFCSSI